jgi:hypothetical protein
MRRLIEVKVRVHACSRVVDGTVVSRSVTMGQTVGASFQTPTRFLIATDQTFNLLARTFR